MAFTFAPSVPGNYVPVIGASFDSDAAQMRGWAELNTRINEGNINRLAQAQQNQNAYQQRLAAMQQNAMDQQAAMEEQAQQRAQAMQAQAAQRAQEQANVEKQFTFAQQQEADKLALGREQIDAARDDADAKAELIQKVADAKADASGQQNAAKYYEFEQASKRARKAADQNKEDVAGLNDQLKGEKDAVKAQQIRTQVSQLQKRQIALDRVANAAENAYQNFHNLLTAPNSGWTATNDELIGPTGKKWSFSNAAKESQEPEGQIEPGNVNLNNRPVVHNADGTISTVRSKSFNIDGAEVLLPTISDDGRVLTDQQAISQYRRTGKHLGKFTSPDAATDYAQQLHEDQADQYGGEDQDSGAAVPAPAQPAPAMSGTSGRFNWRIVNQ
jgi:hypothetical protein